MAGRRDNRRVRANSHYYYYKSSQNNSTFNFGSFAENQLGFSAYSDATFIAIVNGRLQNDAQALSDNINAKGEPCSQHCTADGDVPLAVEI